jgi:NAD+ synthase (glutamine-hydrolysing)
VLRLALAQLDLTVGALAANGRRVLEACAEADAAGADLLLAPELAVSGYPPEDLLFRPAFLEACRRQAEAIAAAAPLPVLFGTPWLDGDRVHNTAVLAADGRDPGPLPQARAAELQRLRRGAHVRRRPARPGLRPRRQPAAATVCEDIWLPTTTNRLAAGGATLVLNISASPTTSARARRARRCSARGPRRPLRPRLLQPRGRQDELLFDGRAS